MQIELCSVHLVQRKALLTDGQIIPVTNLMDEFGDETPTPSEATQFRAGPDRDGKFHTDSLETYGFATTRTLN